MFISQLDEKYYCARCEVFKKGYEVHNTWRCPTCANPVHIKLNIAGRLQSCLRLPPNQLKVGDHATFDNENVHEILDIKKENNYYRIALKRYTALNIGVDDFVPIIIGRWVAD